MPAVRSAKGQAKVKGDKGGRFGILAGLRGALLAAVSYTGEERSFDFAQDDGQ